MLYRIEYAGKANKIARGRKDLLTHLKVAAGTITDIRKLYQSGVSDSVLESYAKYIGEGGNE